jgi:hypothetical protein
MANPPMYLTFASRLENSQKSQHIDYQRIALLFFTKKSVVKPAGFPYFHS